MTDISREEFYAVLQSLKETIDTKFSMFDAKLEATIQKATAEIVKWVVGTAIAIAAAAITVMTFVLNNAAPKAPLAQTMAPVIIQLPVPMPGPAPAAPR